MKHHMACCWHSTQVAIFHVGLQIVGISTINRTLWIQKACHEPTQLWIHAQGLRFYPVIVFFSWKTSSLCLFLTSVYEHQRFQKIDPTQHHQVLYVTPCKGYPYALCNLKNSIATLHFRGASVFSLLFWSSLFHSLTDQLINEPNFLKLRKWHTPFQVPKNTYSKSPFKSL